MPEYGAHITVQVDACGNYSILGLQRMDAEDISADLSKGGDNWLISGVVGEKLKDVLFPKPKEPTPTEIGAVVYATLSGVERDIVKVYCRHGKMIQGIKWLRDAKQLSLRDAKYAFDYVRDEVGLY